MRGDGKSYVFENGSRVNFTTTGQKRRFASAGGICWVKEDEVDMGCKGGKKRKGGRKGK